MRFTLTLIGLTTAPGGGDLSTAPILARLQNHGSDTFRVLGSPANLDRIRRSRFGVNRGVFPVVEGEIVDGVLQVSSIVAAEAPVVALMRGLTGAFSSVPSFPNFFRETTRPENAGKFFVRKDAIPGMSLGGFFEATVAEIRAGGVVPPLKARAPSKALIGRVSTGGVGLDEIGTPTPALKFTPKSEPVSVEVTPPINQAVITRTDRVSETVTILPGSIDAGIPPQLIAALGIVIFLLFR